MTSRTNKKFGLGRALLILSALVLLATWGSVANAGDGFCEQNFSSLTTLEGQSFTLDCSKNNLFLIFWPGWGNWAYNAPNPEYLSTASNGGGPNDPTDPLQYAYDLGVNLLMLNRTWTFQLPTGAISDRQVTSAASQLADRIKEDNVSSGTAPTGFTNPGTPNDLDNTTVYTQRIANLVQQNDAGAPRIEIIDPSTSTTNVVWCAGTGTNGAGGACASIVNNDYTSANTTVIQTHAKNTIAHELAHEVKLRNPPDPKLGIHYKTGTGVILDASIPCTITYAKGSNTQKTRVTWFIATKYATGDRTNLQISGN